MLSRRLIVVLNLLAALAAPTAAQQMPDASLIHGRALPGPELPDGTVTVRVVRESIGNDAPGQTVQVTVEGKTATATTDAMGRAVFDRLLLGREGRATVTVDGEALESQPFTVPTKGGLRVILVAGMAKAAERRAQEATAAAAAPAVKGSVVFGGNSRVLMQFTDDTLQVYYVLEVVNTARNRVDVGAPLVIDLPADAAGTTALEGSSRAATVSGTRLTITGPFDSGTTSVQIAYRLPYASSTLNFVQGFPVAVQQLSVGVEQIGNLAMTSTQLPTISSVTSENGDVFVLGRGPTLPAGTPLALTLTNLPFHSHTPRYVALTLAGAFLVLGAWMAFSSPARDTSRQALSNRRETLMQELAELENRRRDATISSDRYDAARQRVLADLEQVFGDLDQVGSAGGGEGGAA